MIGVLAIYSSLLSIAYWLAFELRFEFLVPGPGEVPEDTNWQEIRLGILPWLVLAKLCILLLFGEFRGILYFFRLPDLTRIFTALALVSLGLVLLWYFKNGEACTPRSIILADFQFSFVFLFVDFAYSAESMQNGSSEKTSRLFPRLSALEFLALVKSVPLWLLTY